MPDALSVDLIGWRGARGRFVAATEDLPQRLGQMVQDQQAVLLHALKEESPTGTQPSWAPYPPGYVHFKDAWRATYQASPQGGTLTVTNESPHAGFVLFPTRPHAIPDPKRVLAEGEGKVLRFPGRDGEPTFRRSIWHPGTTGNPVHERAWQQSEAEVRAALGTVTKSIDATIAQSWEQ